MNPLAPAINVRVDMAYQALKSSLDTANADVYIDEQLGDTSKRSKKLFHPILAIHYLIIIHQFVTAPYAQPTTVDAVKELFSYDDMVKCFACNGVDIDSLFDIFGIPDLVETNVDDINTPPE